MSLSKLSKEEGISTQLDIERTIGAKRSKRVSRVLDEKVEPEDRSDNSANSVQTGIRLMIDNKNYKILNTE